MESIFDYFIRIHVVTSIIFLLIGLGVISRSLWGWTHNLSYGKTDKLLGWTFIIFLYFELFMGIVMYFFLRRPYEIQNINEAMRQSDLRFWAVIHFSTMLFVLIFCQIGWIFTLNSKLSEKKFKFSFIYFGSGILITIISLGYYILQKT